MKDLRPTPLNPAAAGVEVHANAAEQALSGRFIERPDWADGAEILYSAALGALLVGLLPWLGAAWGAGLAAAGIGLAVWLSAHAFSQRGFLLDPVFPAAGALLVYISSSLLSSVSLSVMTLNCGAYSRWCRNAHVLLAFTW